MSHAKILICDDSSLARKQIARAIPADCGVDITFAADGEEGLAVMRGGQIDLLFLDLNMPNLDGYGVLQAAQKEALQGHIVVVSGDIQPEANERVMRFGALDFIKKPVDADRLHAILDQLGITCAQRPETATLPPIEVAPMDGLREVSNIAMGRAADLLARLLGVFVELPVPKVDYLESGELQMALLDVAGNEDVAAVCQGFIGGGVSGEALLILHESSYSDLAALLRHDEELNDSSKVELLMDTAGLLIGAFMNGFSDQLDVGFSISHPKLLGRHADIAALIGRNAETWKKVLAIEVSFGIENYNTSAHLLLLFTEESMSSIISRIAYRI